MGRKGRERSASGAEIENGGDGEVAGGDLRRAAEADLLTVNQSKESKDRAPSAKAAACVSLRSMIKTVTEPRITPARIAPLPRTDSP